MEMETLNTEIKKKIIEFLKTKEFGASSSEIAKKTGHNRITITKYLEIMNANNEVVVEDVAQARLWRLKARSDKSKVLVVDDEPNVVELVSLSLIPGKYEVIKAYSGLDALDRVYQLKPDLVILDLMMPNVDGYEVCKRIKNSSLTRHIPIIILSAKGEVKDKLETMELGADDYITKPFDPMELEARVSTLLRRVRNDIDTHPLTKLPGKGSLEEEIKKKLKINEEFLIYSYYIENTENYKKELGYRYFDDTMSIIARGFANALEEFEGIFLAHIINDKFIVISNSEKVEKKINETFENMLPYITHGQEDSGLKLKKTKVSSKKIINKEKDMNKIFEKLGI